LSSWERALDNGRPWDLAKALHINKFPKMKGDNVMKYILVCGSRTFNNYSLLSHVLDIVCNGFTDICIVSGGARGADSLAKEYAHYHNFKYVEFPAEWNKYGKCAGYIRNEVMHRYISEHEKRKVIAFWDGKSKGTAHNFGLARKYGNTLHVINTY
jgi:hypothetical protein